MTRAMQKLYLSYAKVRRQYGREERHRPSRFLREIPEEFLCSNTSKLEITPPAKKAYSSNISSHNSPYSIGQWIMHKTFGKGIVLNFEGSGEHTRIQVKFMEHGVKWLVLAYAQIHLINS